MKSPSIFFFFKVVHSCSFSCVVKKFLLPFIGVRPRCPSSCGIYFPCPYVTDLIIRHKSLKKIYFFLISQCEFLIRNPPWEKDGRCCSSHFTHAIHMFTILNANLLPDWRLSHHFFYETHPLQPSVIIFTPKEPQLRA